MAARWVGTVLLASGVVALAALGTAGGYGVGLLTSPPSASSSPARTAPIGQVGTPVDGPTTPPPKTTPSADLVPDDTPALRENRLRYRESSFQVGSAVVAHVRAEVPRGWAYTYRYDEGWYRFTDPLGKRWVRFSTSPLTDRDPLYWLERKAARLASAGNATILSRDHDEAAGSATLTYQYVAANTLRHGIVRWLELDDDGTMLEIDVIGLPQDRQAMEAVLERAGDTVRSAEDPV